MYAFKPTRPRLGWGGGAVSSQASFCVSPKVRRYTDGTFRLYRDIYNNNLDRNNIFGFVQVRSPKPIPRSSVKSVKSCHNQTSSDQHQILRVRQLWANAPKTFTSQILDIAALRSCCFVASLLCQRRNIQIFLILRICQRWNMESVHTIYFNGHFFSELSLVVRVKILNQEACKRHPRLTDFSPFQILTAITPENVELAKTLTTLYRSQYFNTSDFYYLHCEMSPSAEAMPPSPTTLEGRGWAFRK